MYLDKGKAEKGNQNSGEDYSFIGSKYEDRDSERGGANLPRPAPYLEGVPPEDWEIPKKLDQKGRSRKQNTKSRRVVFRIRSPSRAASSALWLRRGGE